MGIDNGYKGMLSSVEYQEEKRRIRREMLAVRDALTEEQRRRGTCLITERLLGHQWFYRCECLLCYVSYGSELSTREILYEALRMGKAVYAPKVLAEHRMDFFRIRSLEELQPGFHGIPEPSESGGLYGGDTVTAGRENGTPALMLMPGVAYDPYGNRLGYGGGYYDRYLAAHSEFMTCSIAIGYNCQRTRRQLPVEETDCRPYQVILV